MIKIFHIGESDLETYYKDAKPLFLDYIFSKKDNDKFSSLIDYLECSFAEEKVSCNDSKLRNLLTGDMSCLKEITKQVGTIGKDDLSDNMYDEFVKTESGMSISSFSEAEICPYCNRVPLRAVKGKIRPTYDHYLARSEYAYLSISIYNLIPCCEPCNNLKRVHGEFLYPFDEEFGEDIVFEVSNYNNSDKFDIDIVVKNNASPIINKANTQIERLSLKLLYGSEQKRAYKIIRAIERYNKTSVEALKNTFHLSSLSVEECLSDYLNTNINRNEWNKEEFSKFTHDICYQFLN